MKKRKRKAPAWPRKEDEEMWKKLHQIMVNSVLTQDEREWDLVVECITGHMLKPDFKKFP